MEWKCLMRASALLLSAVMTIGIVRSVDAYCVNTDSAVVWAELANPDEIPVYISVAAQTSVVNMGLGVGEIERLTQEIIARHNEASAGPVLVYAGLTQKDMDYLAMGTNGKFMAREPGITIDSYTCAVGEERHPCGEDPKVLGCTVSGDGIPKVRITVNPFGCDAADKAHMLESNDLGTVLLHEFGHALGLWHDNLSKEQCEAEGMMHGNAKAGNNGVMRATLGANYPALREWRRDDIEGLEAIFGAPPLAEVAFWDDDVFPNSPTKLELRSFLGAAFQRPPASTSATFDAEAGHYLVTTDADSRVIVYTRGEQGVSEPDVVERTPSGRSWGNPGIALGASELFVVWTADERSYDSEVMIRWAVRPLTAPGWSVAPGVRSSGVKRLAAGYAPGVELFVITTLSNYTSRPVVFAVDGDGQLLGTHEISDITAFDIGGAACFAEGAASRCVIPYSTNSFAGPKLGWLDVELDGAGQPQVLDDTSGSFDATGKLGLTSHPGAPRFRGFAGAQRYDLDRLEGIGAVDVASPMPLPKINAEGWPVAIGSSTAADGGVHWWGYARRRVECGNGIIQAFEECDDGNLVTRDGCSDACQFEDSGDDDGVATETGGAYVEHDDGCDCRADAGRRAPIGLVVLVGFGLRRRRVTSPRDIAA